MRPRTSWKAALVVLAVVVVTAFLKWSANVVLPVVYAVMLIALLHPLKLKLERLMPNALAVVLCVLIFWIGSAAFGHGLAASADSVEDNLEPYSARLDAWYQQAQSRLQICGKGASGGAGDGASRWVERGSPLQQAER